MILGICTYMQGRERSRYAGFERERETESARVNTPDGVLEKTGGRIGKEEAASDDALS